MHPMKYLFVLLMMMSASVLHAQTPKVEAMIAEGPDSKPATTFAPDVPKLYAYFRSQGTHTGDKVRGVWIADDVGSAAPKETTIDEAVTLTADIDNFYGGFSLTKPTKGWPAGKYHVDIYLNDKLAVSPEFTITAAKEKEDAGEKNGDSGDN